ncbi:MAG: NADPH cytochrome P450 oxidoreductase family protein [Pseudomonadota bacterium]
MDGFVLGIDVDRWAFCTAIVAVWLVVSWFWMRPDRVSGSEAASVIIAHASQTGTAESFAALTHQHMSDRDQDTAFLPLHLLTAKQLLAAERLLIFASTTGVGEAPDGARDVEQALLSQALKLTHLEVFVLALGDRSYEHYCAFGQRLGDWARATGAKVSVVTVDNQAAEDLASWDDLMLENGLAALDEAGAEDFQEWHIVRCEEIAQGDNGPIEVSRPGPLFRVEMKPTKGAMPVFKVGDLLEWQDADGTRREFSIATLPTDEHVQLIVRRVELPGGAMGRASAALTRSDPSQSLRAKLRPFPNFHETEGGGPLLAIASGSGWGGIRSHVLAAIEQGRPVWLIYGERGPDTDSSVFAEMREWLECGKIARLSIAMSRDEKSEVRYVQDCVDQNGETLSDFLGSDGAIVICGAVAMSDAVSEKLDRALSKKWIAAARTSNRFRVAAY